MGDAIMNMRRAPASHVRDAIARAWLGAGSTSRLGDIVLRPHQRNAVERLGRVLVELRGAMLADQAGLGKTYTALAAARHAQRLLVVAPATLRVMWTDAIVRAGMSATVVSFEALSRGLEVRVAPDFVIVDEAHNARTAGTIRYRALAALCADATTLLLTATPVHNRAADLRAQLALFLGERAWSAPDDEIARFIVKRAGDVLSSAAGGETLPEVDGVEWLESGDDAPLLDEIVTLPPAVPAADAGDGGALLTISLVRQWGSSRAALCSALMRRLARADALGAALAEGRHPTRSELRAWHYADGSLQLAFAGIMSSPAEGDTAAMRAVVEAHRGGLAALLDRVRSGVDADRCRAEAIRSVRARHAGETVIVFAEYAATVETLYARLSRDGGVAMLTDRGGFIPGGRVTRRELLDQLGPSPAAVPVAQRVTMLITTDLLSEGVNLQHASVVVHADLPWSPARFEQRVGRVRRLGSRHARVAVYALRPPAPTERLLNLEGLLRAKITTAARAVGVSGTILPRLFAGLSPEPSPPQRADTALSDALGAWRVPSLDGGDAGPVAAAVTAERSGLLAAVAVGAQTMLIGDRGAGLTSASETIVRIIGGATAREVPLPDAVLLAAQEHVHAWLERRTAGAVVDLAPTAAAPARRQLLRRVDAILARSPRHLRAGLSPIARDARRAATSIVGAGAERVFEELAESRLPDAAWLHAVRTFARLHARDGGVPQEKVRLIALLVLVGPAAAAPPGDGPTGGRVAERRP